MDLLNPPRLDKASVKKFFNRAAKSYDKAAILQEEVQNRLLQRLDYIRHQPETAIDVGCGTGLGIRHLQKAFRGARIYGIDMAHEMLLHSRSHQRWLSRERLVTGDMERIPFSDRAFDLVYSSLALQWCNDLASTLAEFARISRPGALLLFSSFGPSTLSELATSWQQLDNHPHVHRFVDMHDVGDLMLAAGFSQPVIDAEIIRMEYDSFRAVLNDLKDIGATNADVSRRRGLMTPSRLDRLEQSYRDFGFEDGKFIASYEVVYGHAWME